MYVKAQQQGVKYVKLCGMIYERRDAYYFVDTHVLYCMTFVKFLITFYISFLLCVQLFFKISGIVWDGGKLLRQAPVRLRQGDQLRLQLHVSWLALLHLITKAVWKSTQKLISVFVAEQVTQKFQDLLKNFLDSQILFEIGDIKICLRRSDKHFLVKTKIVMLKGVPLLNDPF